MVCTNGRLDATNVATREWGTAILTVAAILIIKGKHGLGQRLVVTSWAWGSHHIKARANVAFGITLTADQVCLHFTSVRFVSVTFSVTAVACAL